MTPSAREPMQVNYSMKLRYSADYVDLKRLREQIAAQLPGDVEIKTQTPLTEADQIPEWTSLIFSRRSGTYESLRDLIHEALERAGVSERFDSA